MKFDFILNIQTLLFFSNACLCIFTPTWYVEKFVSSSEHITPLVLDLLRKYGVLCLLLSLICRSCVHIKEVTIRERLASIFSIILFVWAMISLTNMVRTDYWNMFGWLMVVGLIFLSLLNLTSDCSK